MHRILLIDCHAVGHSAKHATARLSFKHQQTGVIYGFLKRMVHLAQISGADSLAFAWDSRTGKSVRKDIFPDYKKKDEKAPEPTAEEIALNATAYEQFDILRDEILPQLGYSNIWIQDGFEADDIIGSLTIEHSDEYQFIMASSDRDLYQLLNENVSQIKLTDNKVYTEQDFINEWGIEPELWANVKCIAGCAGDGVPGVPKVKELTAIKYLNGQLKSTYKTFEAIESNMELISRNIDLVVLPFEDTPSYEIKKDKVVDRLAWVDICEKYNMKSLINQNAIENWEKFYNH